MNLKTTLTAAGMLIVLVPFLMFAVPQLTPWFNSYIVTSGSMEPSIQTGSAILVEKKPASEIERGDVITFSSKGADQPATTTHRVIDIRTEGNLTEFQTKGDANEEPDPKWVPEDALVGEVILTIPVLGKLIVSLDNVYGYTLLIVIPGLMMIVYEVRRIMDEVK